MVNTLELAKYILKHSDKKLCISQSLIISKSLTNT